MVLQVEGAHERDFWSVWAENGVPFEITMYNLHIMARKLELVDTVFSRYRVMETEREMRHFGLGMSHCLSFNVQATRNKRTDKWSQHLLFPG